MPEYESLVGGNSTGWSWRALTSLEKKLIILSTILGITVFALAIGLATVKSHCEEPSTTPAPTTITTPTTISPNTSTTPAPTTETTPTTISPNTTTTEKPTTKAPPTNSTEPTGPVPEPTTIPTPGLINETTISQ